jgi:outer membrane protein assembly factor BamB
MVGHSTPTADSGVAYIAESTDSPTAGASILFAVRSSDHMLLWHTHVSGKSVAAANGVVYDGGVPTALDSGSAALVALSATSGSVLWSQPIAAVGSEGVWTPTVAGGSIFFGTDTGLLYALSASNGQQLWIHAIGGQLLSAPIVAGGSVYIGPNGGGLYAIDKSSGIER